MKNVRVALIGLHNQPVLALAIATVDNNNDDLPAHRRFVSTEISRDKNLRNLTTFCRCRVPHRHGHTTVRNCLTVRPNERMKCHSMNRNPRAMPTTHFYFFCGIRNFRIAKFAKFQFVFLLHRVHLRSQLRCDAERRQRDERATAKNRIGKQKLRFEFLINQFRFNLNLIKCIQLPGTARHGTAHQWQSTT